MDRRRPTPASKTVNTPGIGGLGITTAGAVEMSNVDLAQTFTNMITAQRGFQANSRVISTADEMLAGPGEPQALSRALSAPVVYA